MNYLRSLQIELTSRCNERCVHCYIPDEKKNLDMETSLLFNLLDQCHKIEIPALTISGGEPLLHPDVVPFLYKAIEYGFFISVFSNLTMLNNEIITVLKKARIRIVQTSLYSVDPIIHDAITKLPGSCERTKNALVKLAQESVPIYISCPIMKKNKDSYGDVIRWAQSIGAEFGPSTYIMVRSDGSTGNIDNRLTSEETLQVIEHILENDPTAYNREQFYPGYNNTDIALPCVQNVCRYFLCVNAAGKVLPSPAWNNVLGDLNLQTLQDILENSVEVKRLRALSLNDFPKCKTCSDIQFCGMNLESNANEYQDGDLYTIHPDVCILANQTRVLVQKWLLEKEEKDVISSEV